MPNWCYTRITFHGNKTEIEDFHEKIDKWTSEEFAENGFGPNWLGNILHRVGLSDRIDSEENRLRCRGSVGYVEDVEVCSDNDATFYIDTETAWTPMLEMWVATIKALKYETIGFSYLAEEPGMCVYEIYDPYGDYDESYYVDTYLCGADENDTNLFTLQDHIYYETDDELIRSLQMVLGIEEADLTKLINKVENYPFKDEDSYIHVHKYEKRDSLEEVD